MERLTEKYNGKNIVKSGHITMIFNNETGNRFEGEAVDKLAAYEDAEEQGIYGKWIPVSERLPEEAYGCLVTVMDYEPSTQTDFENILPYFVGYDGHGWNDADGEKIPFDVTAWMPMPEPYRESEEDYGEM